MQTRPRQSINKFSVNVCKTHVTEEIRCKEKRDRSRSHSHSTCAIRCLMSNRRQGLLFDTGHRMAHNQNSNQMASILCKRRELPANLGDVLGILLHGKLLDRALEAEERLDVQAGSLLEARPFVVLGVNLQGRHRKSDSPGHGTASPWNCDTQLSNPRKNPTGGFGYESRTAFRPPQPTPSKPDRRPSDSSPFTKEATLESPFFHSSQGNLSSSSKCQLTSQPTLCNHPG